MVRSHTEKGSRRRLAQFQDVVGIAIQHRPSDTDRCGRSGDLWQSGATDRLKNNGVRPLILVRLNGFQNLGALRNRVVIRVNDLDFNAQFAGHLLRGLRLFDLVIVVVRCQGNQDTQFVHRSGKTPRWNTVKDTSDAACFGRILRPPFHEKRSASWGLPPSCLFPASVAKNVSSNESSKTTSHSIASRTVGLEAFAPLQPVGLDQFLIGSKRLLRLWQSADAAVSLTQLKVG